MRHLPHHAARFSLRQLGLTLPTLALFAISLFPAQAQTAATLTPAAQKQLAEIAAFKKTFTDAEKKMSLNLILLSRQAHHQPLGIMARFIDPGAIDGTGKVVVNLHADLSPSLMNSHAMIVSKQIDGEVPQSAFITHSLHAHVAATDLLSLAGSSDVHILREASHAHTNVGSVTSQGYVTHTANKAVALGVAGAGINVGVLSDSASPARVAALIASGDLPSNVTVLPGQAGDGEDEGTAMMEIVHDLAPSANLFFATAFNSEGSFADNIRDLRFKYHCDIIVDDISYFDEPVYQDGLIAQAVNDITADGGLYVSAAANSGNLTSGTSGTWDGDFRNGGAISGLGQLHNFGTPGNPQLSDVLTSIPASGVWLHWSDALGKAADDYDLYILDSTGTVVKGASTDTQDGTEDPLESIYPSPDEVCASATPTGYCPAIGDQILVVLYDGSTRAIHIDTERATLSIGTASATFGHNAGKSTFTLAATYWNSAKTGTKPFTGMANPIEAFSSDGPRKIFFNPDGSAITPGKFTYASSGGVTLQKPDATAADGVFTKTPGFLPFFGTSAAAPHAAAIAALVKSAHPSLTNMQIVNILHTTTLDNMEAGVDRDGGYGILMALPAVQAAQATK